MFIFAIIIYVFIILCVALDYYGIPVFSKFKLVAHSHPTMPVKSYAYLYQFTKYSM